MVRSYLPKMALGPGLDTIGGFPFDLEFPRSGFSADKGEAQEVEGLRFAEPAPLAAFRCKASELNQPGLLGMQ